MNDAILELYKKNCHNDKQCTPIPKVKHYANGARHYVTQCSMCGDAYGQPISRSLIKDLNSVTPFDQSKFDENTDKLLAPYKEKSDVESKVRAFVKSLKQEYFENVLKLPFGDFETYYNAYLSSSHWEEKRKKILERDDYLCRVCESKKAQQVHHLSYSNLGNETEWELISVCIECHEVIHSPRFNDFFNNQKFNWNSET